MLAVQAWRPEFRSPDILLESGAWEHAFVILVLRPTDSWSSLLSQSSRGVNERSCLRKEGSEWLRNTPDIVSGLHMHAHTPMCTCFCTGAYMCTHRSYIGQQSVPSPARKTHSSLFSHTHSRAVTALGPNACLNEEIKGLPMLFALLLSRGQQSSLPFLLIGWLWRHRGRMVAVTLFSTSN